MTFTATVADQNRWQRQALDAMTAAIKKGARAGLPPLMWQLGASGCHGRVSTLNLPIEEQRARLEAWAAVLGWVVIDDHRDKIVRETIVRAQEPVSESWMTPRVIISVELFDWDADA